MPIGAISLLLEINADADPVCGLLGLPGGETRNFVGWLGLASALEQLIALQHSNTAVHEDPRQPGRAPAGEHPASS
jgi:hypothetical protein